MPSAGDRNGSSARFGRGGLGEGLVGKTVLALHEAPHEAARQPYHGDEDERRHQAAHQAHKEGGVEPGNGNFASNSPRSIIQCQPVWATRADRIITPMRSSTTYLNNRLSAGTSTTRTESWPISTPRLNPSSEVTRWSPANCSCSRSAKENPKPWINPNPKA